MKTPTISLIIPAYNEEKYIGTCLEYVLKNAHGLLHEIIVVDNASTDRTAEIARRFSGVEVISEKSKGQPKARQCGFEHATGDILAYIDADTRMPAGWVEQIQKEFTKNPKLACLSGPYIYYDLPAWKNMLVALWYLFAMPVYYIVGYMATGGNLALRTTALQAMGGFDTSIAFYGEDSAIARGAHSVGTVLFKRSFRMPTAARRFKAEGFVQTAYTYLINFFAIVLTKKPRTLVYTDIR
jgi:glycosyltransferase involved in cell wall biosynthesis